MNLHYESQSCNPCKIEYGRQNVNPQLNISRVHEDRYPGAGLGKLELNVECLYFTSSL